jgi:hypothetical protein
MPPLRTLRRIPLFGQGPHRSSLPARFRAAIVCSGRQEPARGPDEADHRSVAHGSLAMSRHLPGGLISVTEIVTIPSQWSDQSWTS